VADGGSESILGEELGPDLVGGGVVVFEVVVFEAVLEAVADVDHGAAEEELGTAAPLPECAGEEGAEQEGWEGPAFEAGYVEKIHC
jgi:hypothetical protein